MSAMSRDLRRCASSHNTQFVASSRRVLRHHHSFDEFPDESPHSNFETSCRQNQKSVHASTGANRRRLPAGQWRQSYTGVYEPNLRRRCFSSMTAAPNSTPAEMFRPKLTLATPSPKSTASEFSSSLVQQYEAMASDGTITSDPHQLTALKQLDRLRNELIQNQSTLDADHSLFTKLWSAVFHSKSHSSTPKGVYLHGGVGCGKTFCMDLFYKSFFSHHGTYGEDDDHGTVGGDDLDDGRRTGTQKRLHNLGIQKVHFHKFMLAVHRQMHEAKIKEGIVGDVLPRVIERTIQKGKLICFDEFQVTDVADALILRRLFTGLLDRGAVVVATSNRSPRDLYLNGLQRDRFIPFIDLLEEKLAVVSMWDSETDYRLLHGENKAPDVYFIGNKSKPKFHATFASLTRNSPITITSLHTHGRSVHVPMASLDYKVALFSFDDLCRNALGAADYLVIGETFHTVFVQDVPAALTLNDINVVRRFIIFIDTMYECHVKLVIHAATVPEGIFQVDLTNEVCDEVFAFDRTRSRLEEMASHLYIYKSKNAWAGSKSH